MWCDFICSKAKFLWHVSTLIGWDLGGSGSSCISQGIIIEGGRLSTVDLLVLISPDRLLLILKILFCSSKTCYLNEVKCSEPSPFSVPCFSQSLCVKIGFLPMGDAHVWPRVSSTNLCVDKLLMRKLFLSPNLFCEGC